MLTTAEIIKKVKELEIISKRITAHLFTGEYHSAFKGKGMRFREVREYYEGDDVRFIDWNVSELLTAQPKRAGTNISEALKFFSRSNRHKNIAFVMSDFIDEQYEDKLRVMSSRHDVIGLKIYDKMDMQLPDIGMLEVQDLE